MNQRASQPGRDSASGRVSVVKRTKETLAVREYEITFQSLNDAIYTKPITALVLEPDAIGSSTGAMLCTHGWSGNRFSTRSILEFACQNLDVVCISTEFRQSGYDFNPVTGLGSYVPYDASLLQTLDTLNALRTLLRLRPQINQRRLFHYGGSQGGQIALLSAIFAPRTFAFVYGASPVCWLDERIQGWAGRVFAPFELSARNTIEHADLIGCPVCLEHGTADSIVPCDIHCRALAGRLQQTGVLRKVTYHEGGEHSLEPVTTRLEGFKVMAPEPVRTLTNDGPDDFALGSTVVIPCADRELVIDWSQPAESVQLLSWR